MTIDKFADRFDSGIVWEVKRYKSGHYFMRMTGVKVTKWLKTSCDDMLDILVGE